MITVQFSAAMLTRYKTLDAERVFDNLTHLRDTLHTYAFAPVYRVRTYQNEFGRTVSKSLLAVYDGGQEEYLGEVVGGM